jgi:leader peptidase (prepilin peptidase)/N-methyltransferase
MGSASAIACASAMSEVTAAATLHPSPTRPVALVAGGAAALAAAAEFGASGRTLAAVFFLSVLTVLSAIDIEERRIPNRIVLPASAVLLALQAAVDPGRALGSIVAALAVAGVVYVLVRLNPAGLGMGDAKLALFMGIGLGGDVIAALAVGSVLAALFAVLILISRGFAARSRTFALAPFLAVGSAVVLLAA